MAQTRGRKKRVSLLSFCEEDGRRRRRGGRRRQHLASCFIPFLLPLQTYTHSHTTHTHVTHFVVVSLLLNGLLHLSLSPLPHMAPKTPDKNVLSLVTSGLRMGQKQGSISGASFPPTRSLDSRTARVRQRETDCMAKHTQIQTNTHTDKLLIWSPVRPLCPAHRDIDLPLIRSAGLRDHSCNKNKATLCYTMNWTTTATAILSQPSSSEPSLPRKRAAVVIRESTTNPITRSA